MEVFAETSIGKYSLHELCIHQHFNECVEALLEHAAVIHHWPYNLGRNATHINWDHPVIISAYDPNDPERAFQLECVDPRDSYWAERREFAIKRRRSPRHHKGNILHGSYIQAMQQRRRQRSRRPLRVLELCCGKGKSFSRIVRKMYPKAEITTLDISQQAQPDILADVITWSYLEHYKPGHFDILWASPPRFSQGLGFRV